MVDVPRNTEDPAALSEFLITKTDALNQAENKLQDTLNEELRSFKDNPEQFQMRKAFDYEDRLMVDTQTGEVTMKCYYMHPGRKQDGVFVRCGCFFSAALWKEYKTPAERTRWKCDVDFNRVKEAFPCEYEAALSKHPTSMICLWVHVD